MSRAERFIIVSGKGGVGKSVLAAALCSHWQRSGKEVQYYSFESPELFPTLRQLAIPHRSLNLFESAEQYVHKKLHSRLLAKTIVGTKFFQSLLNMLPGFNYLIFLGDILHQLKVHPHRHIILDAPSSGHLMTMFESSHTFRRIFKRGVLVDDIDQLLSYAYAPGFMRLILLHLPTHLSLTEGGELKSTLSQYGAPPPELWINSFLPPTLAQLAGPAPPVLQRKGELEQQAIAQYPQDFAKILPFIPHGHLQELIEKMALQLESIP